MSCTCVKQAYYALHCLKFPSDIFSSRFCSTHSPEPEDVSKTPPTADTVTLVFCPDEAISKSEDVAKWPVVFHGTSPEVVKSIVLHGQLLMVGDIKYDGNRIERRCGTEGQKSAIWTYPDRPGALHAAGKASYDDGKTEFVVLLRLRQMPGSYEEHKGKGYGYDVWSTNRRATLYKEAIEVNVSKCTEVVEPPALMAVPTSLFLTTFRCAVQRQAAEVLKLLKLPAAIFNMSHNNCYCSTCHPDDLVTSMVVGGEKYAIPRGWTRFGLSIDPVFTKIHDVWSKWPMAFHGCHPKNVYSIIRSRSLLIPHDFLPDGTELQVFSSVNKNQPCYFLSPEIGYSAHPWYAKPIPFKDSDGKRNYFQTVLIFKVRPGSHKKKSETENATMTLFDDYSIISKDEVEWYSSLRGCTHPYGLLFRVLDVTDLDGVNKFFELSADSPFRQTREYSL